MAMIDHQAGPDARTRYILAAVLGTYLVGVFGLASFGLHAFIW
jgi:hypothetical protein